MIVVRDQMRTLITNEESTLLRYIVRSWGAGPTLIINRLRLQIISSHSPLLLLRWRGVFVFEVILVLASWRLLRGGDYRWCWHRLLMLCTCCHNRVMLNEAPTWAFVQACRPCFLRTSCDSGDPLAPEARKRLLLLEGWRMACYLMRFLWSLEGQALVLMRIGHHEVIWGRLLHHVNVVFVLGALRWLVGRSLPLWNYWALLLLLLDHCLACWGTSRIHNCRLPAWLSCLGLVYWWVSRHEGLPGHWGKLIVCSLLDLADGGAIKGITWVSGNAPIYQLLGILLHCTHAWRVAVVVCINYLWVHLSRLNLPDQLWIDRGLLEEVPLLLHLLLLNCEHIEHIPLLVTHGGRAGADACRCLIPRKAAVHWPRMALHRSIISRCTLHQLWVILVVPHLLIVTILCLVMLLLHSHLLWFTSSIISISTGDSLMALSSGTFLTWVQPHVLVRCINQTNVIINRMYMALLNLSPR